MSSASISEEIYKMIIEHRRDFYNWPEAVILGPDEYLQFKTEMIERMPYLFISKVEEITDFDGIKIRVKRSPGIDIEVNPAHSLRFAPSIKGEVKT